MVVSNKIQFDNKEISEVIRRLILNKNHRLVIEARITKIFFIKFQEFLKQCNEFKTSFQESWIDKALDNEVVSTEFLQILGGLANKSIENMYGSAKREIVKEVTKENIKVLRSIFNEKENKISEINIKLGKKKIVFNAFEANLLAKNIGILYGKVRGGNWSALGKNVETPLMLTLCKIFSIPKKNFSIKDYNHLSSETNREVDFYLLNNDKKSFKCEVKLMGRGNPESGDSVFARDTKIFIADKLSNKLKKQLESENIYYIELDTVGGYKYFSAILKKTEVPFKEYSGDLVKEIDDLISLK